MGGCDGREERRTLARMRALVSGCLRCRFSSTRPKRNDRDGRRNGRREMKLEDGLALMTTFDRASKSSNHHGQVEPVGQHQQQQQQRRRRGFNFSSGIESK